MLSPKRVKFRKMFKGRMKGLSTRGSTVAFGAYGLQALEPGWVSNRQIEAARVALTRHIKRGGKVWIRIFPDKVVTSKPAETRVSMATLRPRRAVPASRATASAICAATSAPRKRVSARPAVARTPVTRTRV